MKKLRIVLWVLMVLVVAAVGGVLVLTQLVDPNDYKPEIARMVEERTGRKIDLQGELQLTFFPWIGVETGKVALSNAPGFGDEPMVAAENLRVQAKLLPLLKRQLEVDTVVVDTPVIRLLTDADGRTNWEDLTGGGDARQSPEEQGAAAVAGLAVQGVSIVGGRVTWRNDQNGQLVELADLDLTTGTLVPGEPLDVSLSVDVDGNVLPEPARLELDSSVTLSGNMTSVGLAGTRLALASESHRAELTMEKLSYALEAGLAAVTGLNADIHYLGVDSNLVVPSLNVNLSDETVELPSLEITQGDDALSASLRAAGFLVPGLEGKFSLRAGDVAALLERNGIDGIELPASLTAVDGGAAFTLRDHALELRDMALSATVNDQPTRLEAAALGYHLREETLSLPAVQLEQGDFRLSASVDGNHLVSDPAARSLSGTLDLALVDIAELLSRNGIPADLPTIPVGNIQLKGGFDLAGSRVSAKTLAANFDYAGQPTRIAMPSVSLDLDSGALEMPELAVEQGDFTLRGSASGSGVLGDLAAMNLAGALSLQTGDLGDLLTRNAFVEEALPPAAPSSIQAGFDYSVRENTADLSNLEAALDDMTLAGSVRVDDLSALLAAPSDEGASVAQPGYRFDLRINRLDLDALLAGEEVPEAEQPGTAEQLLLPVAPLHGLNVAGRARIGELITTGLTLSEVDLRVTSRDDALTLAPVSANLFGGVIETELTYDVSGSEPAMHLAAESRGVDTGALLQALEVTDKVEGRGSLGVDLRGQGADVDQLLGALGGNILFELRDGAIKGFDLQAALLELEEQVARYRGEETEVRPKPEAETRFAELSGSFRVDRGVFHNDDLALKAPLFRVGGEGDIDLPGDRIDYRLDVNVVESVEGQGGKALDELRGERIPFKIYGPIASPSYTLDLSSLVKEQAREEVKKRILEELGVESGQDAARRESSNDTRRQEQPEDPKKALEKQLKEQLTEGLLKGLGF